MLPAVRGNFSHARPLRCFDHQQMVHCAADPNLSNLVVFYRSVAAVWGRKCTLGNSPCEVWPLQVLVHLSRMSCLPSGKLRVKTRPGGSILVAQTVVLQ